MYPTYYVSGFDQFRYFKVRTLRHKYNHGEAGETREIPTIMDTILSSLSLGCHNFIESSSLPVIDPESDRNEQSDSGVEAYESQVGEEHETFNPGLLRVRKLAG